MEWPQIGVVPQWIGAGITAVGAVVTWVRAAQAKKARDEAQASRLAADEALVKMEAHLAASLEVTRDRARHEDSQARAKALADGGFVHAKIEPVSGGRRHEVTFFLKKAARAYNVRLMLKLPTGEVACIQCPGVLESGLGVSPLSVPFPEEEVAAIVEAGGFVFGKILWDVHGFTLAQDVAEVRSVGHHQALPNFELITEKTNPHVLGRSADIAAAGAGLLASLPPTPGP